MQVERRENQIAVRLSREEVFAVSDGRIIGDRPGVTMPDAKIEVLPLSAIEEDDSGRNRYASDRLERAIAAPLRGNLFPNGDLQIIVPSVKLSDVRVSQAELSREQIETPLTEQGKELLEHVIPEGGVVIYFGGSLREVDVNKFFNERGED